MMVVFSFPRLGLMRRCQVKSYYLSSSGSEVVCMLL